MRNIVRTCFAFIYNARCADCAGILYPVQAAAQSDDRKRRHDLQLGVRDQQCTPLRRAAEL